jgi:prepilin-type N-terminal cleavage/methylation domain-containing protein
MKTSRGFTLIELLVVIAIIGILSAVVLASLNTARAKGRDASRLRQVSELNTAFQLYLNDHSGTFPTVSVGGTYSNTTCLKTSGTCWGGLAATDANIANPLKPYISTLPTDPQPTRGVGDSYIYLAGTTPHGCTAEPTAMVTGHFIIWYPDKSSPNQDRDCLGKGMTSCCYAMDCSSSYYCAYQMD